MIALLRPLAFPIACALTGAAAGLLVVQLGASPCPQEPASEASSVEALALPVPAPVPPPDDAVRCPADGHCVVTVDKLAALFTDQEQGDPLRIMPSVKDGRVRGLKVYGLRPDSLPKQLGLKNGDLLAAIDGQPLTSVGDVLAALQRRPASLELEIERKGQRFHLRVDLE